MPALWIAVLLLASLSSCDSLETRERVYDTYDVLASAGEPGNWVPAFLPRSAENIRIRYKVDSGAVLLSFQFEELRELELAGHCDEVDGATISFPPRDFLGANWWPETLVGTPGPSDLGDYQLFQCERDALMAVQSDRVRPVGFYWRFGPAPTAGR